MLQNTSIQGTVPQALGTSLREFLVARTRLSGTTSMLSTATELISFIAAHNIISGHIPAPIPLKLATLELSRNKLSGTIGVSLASSTSLQDFLVNDMSLSGSLPATSRRSSSFTNLSTFSVTRNFLTGNLDIFDSATQLETVLLSSNRFSCKIPGFYSAQLLAR